jgi:hypothetical protein
MGRDVEVSDEVACSAEDHRCRNIEEFRISLAEKAACGHAPIVKLRRDAASTTTSSRALRKRSNWWSLAPGTQAAWVRPITPGATVVGPYRGIMKAGIQTVSYEALIENLVREIGRLLGKDATYLTDKITFHRVTGRHPNWGADIGAVSPYELSAFQQALESMLALYDLD